MEKEWSDLDGGFSGGVDTWGVARTGVEISLSNENGEDCVENRIDVDSRHTLGVYGSGKHYVYDYYYICQNIGEQREDAPWGQQLVFGEE